MAFPTKDGKKKFTNAPAARAYDRKAEQHKGATTVTHPQVAALGAQSQEPHSPVTCPNCGAQFEASASVGDSTEHSYGESLV